MFQNQIRREIPQLRLSGVPGQLRFTDRRACQCPRSQTNKEASHATRRLDHAGPGSVTTKLATFASLGKMPLGPKKLLLELGLLAEGKAVRDIARTFNVHEATIFGRVFRFNRVTEVY